MATTDFGEFLSENYPDDINELHDLWQAVTTGESWGAYGVKWVGPKMLIEGINSKLLLVSPLSREAFTGKVNSLYKGDLSIEE